jgi:SAM-dependent methyltransferase
MSVAARASAIAHGDLPFHNPLDERTLDDVLALLPLDSSDRVLDAGCGTGELLVRIAERTGAGGLGVDIAEDRIRSARALAAARVPGAELAFEAADATSLNAEPASFAVAACVGSTHALGGLAGTLDRLSALVRRGGYLLVGEGFWERPPQPAYLEALGATEDELTDFAGLVAAGDARGLALVHAATTDHGAWDRYEWTYLFNADRYASEHPGDEVSELLRERVDATRRRRLLAAVDGETLGFALLLWRLPSV